MSVTILSISSTEKRLLSPSHRQSHPHTSPVHRQQILCTGLCADYSTDCSQSHPPPPNAVITRIERRQWKEELREKGERREGSGENREVSRDAGGRTVNGMDKDEWCATALQPGRKTPRLRLSAPGFSLCHVMISKKKGGGNKHTLSLSVSVRLSDCQYFSDGWFCSCQGEMGKFYFQGTPTYCEGCDHHGHRTHDQMEGRPRK